MDIITEPQGHYWPLGDCRIGPYRDMKECREDYERYLKTGKASVEPPKNAVACCADCEP